VKQKQDGEYSDLVNTTEEPLLIQSSTSDLNLRLVCFNT